jgi:hypothetical protein
MVMKYAHLLALSAAASALLIFAATKADAQQGQLPPRIILPSHGGAFGHGGLHGRGRHGGFGFPGVWVVEREVPVIIEREVVREVRVIVEPPEPPPQREPYVIGKSYASLPGGCMKVIEEGASYYYCSGEWYRQVGKQYRAVAGP